MGATKLRIDTTIALPLTLTIFIRKSMAFSSKSRLVEQEVKEGENSVLRRFATDNASDNPHDSLAGALDLVMNRTSVQCEAPSVIANPFRSRWRSDCDGIPVYAKFLFRCVFPDLGRQGKD